MRKHTEKELLRQKEIDKHIIEVAETILKRDGKLKGYLKDSYQEAKKNQEENYKTFMEIEFENMGVGI